MFKFANASCAVRWKGSVVRLNKGDAWSSDDPFVKDRPDFFDDSPTMVHATRGAEQPIEQTTARPGEKRNARRG